MTMQPDDERGDDLLAAAEGLAAQEAEDRPARARQGSVRRRQRVSRGRAADGSAILNVDEDTGELIEAGAASCVLQVDPDDGPRVRAFATQINGAASLVAERRAATARELAEARAELAAVREDHSVMDAARERLAQARVDASALARIAAAEQELAQAHSVLASVRQVAEG